MANIINMEHCLLSERNGMYGGQAGYKDGIIYNGDYWIVKYAKSTEGMTRVEELSYTTSPLSEYIGSHIYQALGYETHETLLVYRRSRIAVACKDFCKDNERLLEIRTIKNAVNDQLEEALDRSFSSTGSDHSVDFPSMQLHLKYNDILRNIPGVTERFFDMIVVDALINNNDRNNGNWGVIRGAGRDRLAPVFDNGGSFYTKLPESRLHKKIADPNWIRDSAIGTQTSYSVNGKIIRVEDMFQMDIPELDAALKRVIPRVLNRFSDMRQMIMDIPEQYEGLLVCSADRKDYYIQTMAVRMNRILYPAYEQAIERSKAVTEYESEEEIKADGPHLRM